MGRNPEHRDGLLEDEAPLHTPVHFADVTFHINGLEERGEGAAVLADVHVGDLVHGHEDGREGGVHHHADAEGAEEFQPRHRACHGGGNTAEGCITLHERRDAETENTHRQGNPHTQKSPNDKFRSNAETFMVIFARSHTASQHLPKRSQYAEFQKGHP